MDPVIKFNIAYDCECEFGVCSHARKAIDKAMQDAYEAGIKDGITKTMAEIRSGLKQMSGKGKGYVEAKPKKKALPN